MIILDAYAILAYLRAENAAEEVASLLRGPTVFSPVNLAEAVDQLVRTYGADADDVAADLALLEHSGMHVSPALGSVGVFAGELRARHYNRRSSAVSLADCFAAATALSGSHHLATSDPTLARMVRAEGGAVHTLPDRRGSRP